MSHYPTNRRLTKAYHGQPVTNDLLQRIGPRCAIEIAILRGKPVVRRVRDRSIPYKLTRNLERCDACGETIEDSRRGCQNPYCF
jgi:hypothetical protein